MNPTDATAYEWPTWDDPVGREAMLRARIVDLERRCERLMDDNARLREVGRG